MTKDYTNFDSLYRKKSRYNKLQLINAFSSLVEAIKGKDLHNIDDNEILFKRKSPIVDILKWFGEKFLFSYKNEGSIEEQIRYVCRKKGIMYRKVNLAHGWSSDVLFPILVKRKDNGQYVSIIPKAGRYFFNDNINGILNHLTKSKEALFENDAFIFYKPFPKEQMTIIDLLKFSFSFISIKDIIILIFSSLIIVLLGLFIPYISKFLVGSVVELEDIDILTISCLYLLGVTVIKLIFELYKELCLNSIITKCSLCIESAAFIKLLLLPLSFYKQYSSGNIARRFSLFRPFWETFINIIFVSVLTTLFSLLYIPQIASFAPSLCVPSIIIIFTQIICSIIFIVIKTARLKFSYLLENVENGLSYSVIRGIQKIKSSGSETRIMSIWASLYARISHLRYKPIFVNVISIIVSLLGWCWIYVNCYSSQIAISDFYAFTTAYASLFVAITEFVNAGNSISTMLPTLESINPILGAKLESCGEKPDIEVCDGQIEVNSLFFKYPDNDEYIFKNLSFKIRANEYVAIVGKTGCGKSTLLKILLGFEKNNKGTISYDGQDINNYNIMSLRRNIGSVFQNSNLLQRSIYDNIILNSDDKSLKAAWKAAEIAQISDDIKSMPMKMQTLISDGSGNISAGQRQRILIARAIAHNPKILIFDEATSALDNITQKQISDEIAKLNCTRLVVAHRLSTIIDCDRIICIDKGRIIEEGTYDDLINKKGFFTHLVEQQVLDSK